MELSGMLLRPLLQKSWAGIQDIDIALGYIFPDEASLSIIYTPETVLERLTQSYGARSSFCIATVRAELHGIGILPYS